VTFGAGKIEALIRPAEARSGTIDLGPATAAELALMMTHEVGRYRVERVYWSVGTGVLCGVTDAIRTTLTKLVAEIRAGTTGEEGAPSPAGSPCRTGKGRVTAEYHTARFRLVPRLAKSLTAPVLPLRRPGSAWTELPRLPAACAASAGHVRIGYARGSTVRQSLDSQADSLKTAAVTKIFAEKISTRGHQARAR
jgi:hypothetical protein